MRILTSEEVKAVRIRALGEELGEAYHALVNELSWILLKWDQYVSLFGTRPERVELLNTTAPLFFAIVEDALWSDVLLHLCRLTDSEVSSGKPNLSIKRIPALIDRPEFRGDVTRLVEAAVTSTAFARDWRNRRLAHSDLSLSIAPNTVLPLAEASRASVKKALECLVGLLKRIHQVYFDSDIDLNLAGEPGDAISLLHVLVDGVHAARARLKRFEDGELSPTDWIVPPSI